MLGQQLRRIFRFFHPELLTRYRPELDAFLHLLLYRHSILIDMPSPGSFLQNITYRTRIPPVSSSILSSPAKSILSSSTSSTIWPPYQWSRPWSWSRLRQPNAATTSITTDTDTHSQLQLSSSLLSSESLQERLQSVSMSTDSSSLNKAVTATTAAASFVDAIVPTTGVDVTSTEGTSNGPSSIWNI
jgi:hypothetical protein